MKRKKELLLFIILVILIVIIIYLNNVTKFHPPKFDHNTVTFNTKPENIIKINDDYSFSINGNPEIKNNYLYINFYSLSSDNIYLKLRLLEGDEVKGESGLIKGNEYLERIKISKLKGKKLTYLIMSYDKDTYYSMGEVRLNIDLGEQ